MRPRPHRAGRRSQVVDRQVTWRAPVSGREQLPVAPDPSGILCAGSAQLNRTIVTRDGTTATTATLSVFLVPKRPLVRGRARRCDLSTVDCRDARRLKLRLRKPKTRDTPVEGVNCDWHRLAHLDLRWSKSARGTRLEMCACHRRDGRLVPPEQPPFAAGAAAEPVDLRCSRYWS